MQSVFRDSPLWQRAMELSTAVYAATKIFLKEDMFGLTNQLRRASVSVPSNIAEGQSRLTAGEFIHFLGIARGSTLEVQTQLELATRLGVGNANQIAEVQNLSIEVLRILNSSITGIREKQKVTGKQP